MCVCMYILCTTTTTTYIYTYIILGSGAKDGYGVLEKFLGSLSRESGYETWKCVFQKIDSDQSGLLDASELKRALGQLGGGIDDAQIAMVMNTLDSDKDGQVTYEEFSNALEVVELRMEQELVQNDVMNDPAF